MGRNELKLYVLNGTAKMLAGKAHSEEHEFKLLVRGVMEYMLENGSELIQLDNLYVQVSFAEGIVMSFLIDDGAGRIRDLERFAGEFESNLEKNRKSGIRRLLNDLSGTASPAPLTGMITFSSN